jgi:lipid-A-disaccharide synthase-like uncharacterized protein
MKILNEFFEVLSKPMALVGLVGQGIFFTRFLVQWIVSEKRGVSVVPTVFWYLSIAGAVLVLLYAIWRRDPVFTIAQIVGMFVYIRNLMLIKRKKFNSERDEII